MEAKTKEDTCVPWRSCDTKAMLFFFTWRIITLQCCGGLCHIPKRISHTSSLPLAPPGKPIYIHTHTHTHTHTHIYTHTHTHTYTHTHTHTHTHTLILHFELPSTHLFHPCRSSQSIMLGFLCYTAKNAEFLKGKKKSPNLENHFPWHCLWKDPRMNYKYTLYHVSMPDLMVNYILQCLKLARKVNGPMNIQPD